MPENVLTPEVINRVILLFTVFMGMLLVIMCILLVVYSDRKKQRERRRALAQAIVQKAIFHDFGSEVPYGFYGHQNVQDSRFREVLVDNIITACKNLSGSAFLQLKQLYEQLQLEKYALQKLNSTIWYKKARAIQELAVLQLDQYVPNLLKLVNHPNELVRMETQTALLQLQGFKGLDFLFHINYPISDWQQIKLLHELHDLPPTVDEKIIKWLTSDNDTVCIFAIRIIKRFHLFQLHDELLGCLEHPKPKVRQEAIITLKDIYTPTSSSELKKRYADETPENQLTIIQVLQYIGVPDDIAFLKGLIDSANNELKLALVRTLAAIDETELTQLEIRTNDAPDSLNGMIRQIKGEIAA